MHRIVKAFGGGFGATDNYPEKHESRATCAVVVSAQSRCDASSRCIDLFLCSKSCSNYPTGAPRHDSHLGALLSLQRFPVTLTYCLTTSIPKALCTSAICFDKGPVCRAIMPDPACLQQVDIVCLFFVEIETRAKRCSYHALL